MSTKTIKNYTFLGLGFPVILDKVEIRIHGKDEYPIINSRKLQDAVFDILIDSPVKITGAQLIFIRKYMELSQSELAAALDLNTHARVSQWEAIKDKIAEIRPIYLAALRAQMAKFRGRTYISTDFFTQTVEGQLSDPKPVRLKSAA